MRHVNFQGKNQNARKKDVHMVSKQKYRNRVIIIN
jgi:hypothetical protein